MNTIRLTALIPLTAVALLFLGGCTTRSISNAGYQGETGSHRSAPPPEFSYRGELSEFDVLAIRRDQHVTDAEIQRALASAQQVRLRKGSSLLLVQSGAVFPDGPMITELRKHFTVTPFSGRPSEWNVAGGNFANAPVESYSRALRLAAAQSGSETILCYWGALESASTSNAGRTVSWVPVVGRLVPDKSQQMRIRLKVALIDVRSGSWTVLCPEPFEDEALSAKLTRERSDLRQVESLKGKAYAACVKDLLENYATVASR